MIKNIILDIGGVICDDGYRNLSKVLNIREEQGKEIAKIAYGGDFKKCLLGESAIIEHIKNLQKNYPELATEIEYILAPQNYKETFPVIQETLELVLKLKAEGYKIYILSNITKESFEYFKNVIKFEKYFDGGAYSFQEVMIKPNYEFYEVLIKKYDLVKEECIFFDDKQKNVEAGNRIGIKSIKFNTIEDIKKNLM